MNNQLLYQHGTLGALVPGLFQGTLAIGELLKHGDTGIGTLTGLDGELIMIDGVVYQVSATGQVTVIENGEVPFANVHFADFKPAGDISGAAATVQQQMLAALGTHNLFAAVQIRGTFAHMTTRAVKAQQRPYPGLAATAADQAVFTREQVAGTLLGYWSPQLYAGMASPGFHLHFLADDHQFGGHVLDYTVAAGTLATQVFSDIQLHLPTTDSEFLNADLDGDLLGDITKAEH
ncbi:acetolactate decarboxylase [Lacticaseibacillus salsurivasis]|uniref:acetolactate decarboxylase n=1 Tax=Lacticaseibacillus salsurivasis TaxID=3081441 RepID=UPI0030C6F532